MIPFLFSLLFSLVLMIISLALVYWVIKSAINDSELISLLREINHKLSTLDSKKEYSQSDSAKAHTSGKKGNYSNSPKELIVDGVICPACNSMIARDSKICPECGIVFLDDEK